MLKQIKTFCKNENIKQIFEIFIWFLGPLILSFLFESKCSYGSLMNPLYFFSGKPEIQVDVWIPKYKPWIIRGILFYCWAMTKQYYATFSIRLTCAIHACVILSSFILNSLLFYQPINIFENIKTFFMGNSTADGNDNEPWEIFEAF